MVLWTRAEIEIVDFKQDPANDCAFAVLFDLRGPGNRYELVTVYFTETFLEKYFSIPWHKDLAKEEERLTREKRGLFIQWALAKIEQYLKGKIKEDKIFVDYSPDAPWAEKVEKGLIPVSVRKKEERVYLYEA